MSEKRRMNSPPARLGRLVGLSAFVVLMAVICLLSPGSPLRAAPKPALLGGPTEVGGIIDTDTTWTAADSPYVVTANTLVSSGITLTIEPGVTISYNGQYFIQVDGTLIASGTVESPIVFQAGGKGITFTDSSVDYDPATGTGSVIAYTRFEDINGYSATALTINSSSPLITHNWIYPNGNNGISASGTNSEISYNEITGTGYTALSASGNPTVENNYIHHNDGRTTINGGVFRNNTVIDNRYSNACSREVVYVGDNSLVEHNLFYDTSDWYATLVTGEQCGWSSSVVSVTLRNNTLTYGSRGFVIGWDISQPISENNFIGNPSSHTDIYINGHSSPVITITAKSNYWNTTSAETIESRIHDYRGDFTVPAIVDYSDFATTPFENTPPTPPGTPTHSDASASAGTDDDLSLDFSWDASWDDISVDHYNVYVSTNAGAYISTTTTLTNSVTLAGTDGYSYTIKIEAVDTAGKVSWPSGPSDPVTVSLPPIEINAGDEYAASTAVTLTLRAPFTADQMRFSHNGSAWNDWEDYAATRDWTLQAGDGTKAVYGQFYGGGQTSDVYSDTIVLDTTPPTVTLEIAAGAYAVNTTTVTVTVAGSDATSGLDTLEWSDDGSAWGDTEPFAAGTHTRTLEPNTYDGPDFGPQVTYGVDGRPFFVTVGDLDKDGDLDLITASWSSDTISVLLNQGDGTFASRVDYSVGDGPWSLAVGDLDRDGDLDLVTANRWGDNVSVLLNQGDGTFASRVDYSVGDGPKFVVVGDLDGDCDLDLVTTNDDSNSVSVLLNQGNGIFSSRVDYGVSNGPKSPAVGDLDGDGDLDLVTPNEGSHNISVLLNQGDGTFSNEVNHDVGSSPRSVVAGDLDGDGDVDLITVNYCGNVSVLMNQGDAIFPGRLDYSVGHQPKSVAVGDLDGDGDLDLVTANMGDDNISILLNQGDGTFASRVDYGVGDEPESVAGGDLDRDGDLDLVVANSDDNNISVLMNHLHLPPLEPTPLYVRASDHVGWSTVFSDTVYVDTAAPSGGSLVIADDAQYTAQLNVELTPAAYDQLGADHMEMAFRNAGDGFGDWVAYSTTHTWTLPSGDGDKKVEARYRDVAGNVSDVVSDTITLDQTPPTGSSVSINDGAATTTQVTVTLTLAGSDALSGVSQMRFSADGSSWDAWETFATTHTRVLDATDGVQAVYLQLRDTAGNVATAVSDTITVEVNPPLGEVAINDGATWTNQVTVTLTLTATDAGSGVARMRLREAGGVWGSWIDYTAAYSFTLSGGDGTKTVEVQYEDGYGRQTDTLDDSIVLDTAAPSGSISVNDDATYTNSTSVTLSLSGSDATSGVAQMCFSNDGTNWSDWESYDTSKAWTLASGDGTKTVYVKYQDNAGNVSTPYTDTITLDTTEPTGSVSINDGATYADTTSVTLALSADDALSGVAQMRFSNDGSNWSDWESYGTSKSWTLTTGDGTKTVYVQYKDNAGNVGTYTDSIILDTGPPSSSVGDLPTYQSTLSFPVSWSGSDAGSGVASYDVQVRDGVSWEDWQVNTVATSTDFVGTDGHTYYFQSRARDNAGNVETYPGGDGDAHTTVDVTAPDGTVVIEGGATYVTDTSVNLTLSANDATSGVAQMRFSNDGSNWSGWESYGASKAWTLASGDGTKTVYVEYKDNVGNVSTAQSDTIVLDTTSPTVGLTAPDDGATVSGTVTVSADASDANGVAQVRFYVADELLASDTSPPWGFDWDTTS